ncbi:MAG: cyclic-di-AMP receptor [Peptococcaceae bacterium]|nr:cyclic-di-AMP receptor [Peptococcaceae bacterium]
MKLIMCIVDDMDIHALLDSLSEAGFQATKLASSGGFLRRGNTTLLIGVDDEKKDAAIELIRKVCKPRKQMIPMTPMLAAEESIMPVDVMVRLGGATVFVMDVAEHYKI